MNTNIESKEYILNYLIRFTMFYKEGQDCKKPGY